MSHDVPDAGLQDHPDDAAVGAVMKVLLAECESSKKLIKALTDEILLLRQWRPMRKAPRDGTRVLLRMKHVGPHCAAWSEVGFAEKVWMVNPYTLYAEEETLGWLPLPKWMEDDDEH